MENYAAIPAQDSTDIIKNWHSFIIERLTASPFFAIMPDMQKTNLCIISFKCLCHGNELDGTALTKLFEYLVTRQYHYHHQKVQLFIGQPVSYGKKSFLRLAIGSDFVQKQYHRIQTDYAVDCFIIDKLEQAIQELFASV